MILDKNIAKSGGCFKRCPVCAHEHNFPQIEENNYKCISCEYDFSKKTTPNYDRLTMTNPPTAQSSDVTYSELHAIINDFSERMDSRIQNIDARCTNMFIDNAKTIEHLRIQRRPEELNIIMERLERLENLHKRILTIEDFIKQNYVKDSEETEERLRYLENSVRERIGHLGEALHNLSEQNAKLQSTTNHRPYKCPVCEGSRYNKPELKTVDASMFIDGIKCETGKSILFKSLCTVCYGKGIVWG